MCVCVCVHVCVCVCACVCEQIDIVGGCLTTLLCCLPLTPELFRCSLNISSRDADKLMSLNIPSSLDVNWHPQSFYEWEGRWEGRSEGR